MRSLLLGSLLALSIAVQSPASATVVRGLSLFDKTQIAPLVIRAEVERVEPVWEVPGGSVKTLVTVRVLEVLKGAASPGDHLILRQAGGRIGDFDHRIEGADAWVPGEESVLFLEPLGEVMVPIGIGIGKYEIEPSPSGKLVTHHPKVALAFHQPGGSGMRIEPAQAMEPEPLETFLARLRNYAAGDPTEPGQPRRKARIQTLKLHPGR
jgi:hypothetical protein